jgi:hypothetical protein
MAKVADIENYANDSVKISAMNIKNPNQKIVVYSNPTTGQYELKLPQGGYQITYEANGGSTVTNKLELPLLNPSDSIVVPGTILAKSVSAGDKEGQPENNIAVLKSDTSAKIINVSKNQAEPGNEKTQVVVDQNPVADSSSEISSSAAGNANIDIKTVKHSYNNLLLISTVLALGILFLFFIFWRRKRNNK